MKPIELTSALHIYKHDCPSISRYRVSHTDFMKFCFELNRLSNTLGDLAKDTYWMPVISFFKRYRYRMCASPLPFNHSSVIEDERFESLKKCLSKCESMYPAVSENLSRLLDSYAKISPSGDNPLLERILEHYHLTPRINTAILVKNSHLIQALEELFSDIPAAKDFEIIIPGLLRGGDCYGRIYIVGPSNWFPEYVLTAPRSSDICIVHYGWIKDRWATEPAFAKSNITLNQEPVAEKEAVTFNEYIEADDILPHIDLEDIASRLTSKSDPGRNIDDVDAKILILDGELFVPVEKSGKNLVIDSGLSYTEDDGNGHTYLKRVPGTDIEVGMFILLRTSGGGDFIIPVADKIMGDNANVWRAVQRTWKNKLREAVVKADLLTVSIDLIDLGSKLANEANVRNWMSERNIKPANRDDFAAIMKLIGMENETGNYWEIASAIDGAHKSAGALIRKLLLKQVIDSDLRSLEKKGRMDFEIHEAGGGSLTAFRISNILKEDFRTPSNSIGCIKQLGDDLWQE